MLGEIEVASKAYLDRVFVTMGETQVEEFVRLMESFAASAEEVQLSAEFRP